LNEPVRNAREQQIAVDAAGSDNVSESTTTPPRAGLIDGLGLRWFFRLLSSSIGQKFVMAITGLLLCGFLVAHLEGNLLLFASAEKYNAYAHFLHSQELLLMVAETGLFLLFFAHIYLAFSTAWGNVRGRVNHYAVKQSKLPSGLMATRPSTWMFASGAVVLGFVILHLIDMKFQARPDITYLDEHNPNAPYTNALAVLGNPISRVVYTLGVIVLGFHLAHGVSSAFQSLGLNHPKYTPLIKWIGLLFAFAITVGFASLPILVPSIMK
jgi:succinate dehydrogenase cytochrome b subunit